MKTVIESFVKHTEYISSEIDQSDNTVTHITYRDTGKPNYSKPVLDVISSLYDLGLRELPKKPKFTKTYAPVKLSDGTSIVWYKSSPPSARISIDVKTAVLDKYLILLKNAAGNVQSSATSAQEKIWALLHDDVKSYLGYWSRPLTAADIISGDKDTVYINWDNSYAEHKKLPKSYSITKVGSTTSYVVKTDKTKFTVNPHTFNSTLKIELV